MITLEILGNPKALKRHRTFRRGNFIGSYDPSKGDKKDFLSVVQDNAPDKPLTSPLCVMMHFYFPYLKGHYGTGKNAGVLKKNAPAFKTSKPDCDNLIKFVADALNGAFWLDDSIIVMLYAIKAYSEKPRTVITITELVKENLPETQCVGKAEAK